MKSEYEKMRAGEWYDANFDEELSMIRLQAKTLCDQLNATPHQEVEKRQELLAEILQVEETDVEINSPFQVDYGKNIRFGRSCFVNHYGYFMDGATITIGDYCFIGPHCGFYTANHPLTVKERNAGLEKAAPISVGDNCWFGAHVSVMPGVTIGKNCVIAAGAVVTKDIPDNSLAAGVPAKIVRVIEQNVE